MSWQTPGGDPPPEAGMPPPGSTTPPRPDPAATEPGADTARAPVGETPPTDPSTPSEPPSPSPPPAAGIISARPVGWTDPAQAATGGTPPDAPAVYWAPPAPQAAAPVGEGLVIAGVFSRIVAYFADLVLLSAINITVRGLLGIWDQRGDQTLSLLVSGVLIGVDFLYFVGLWSSGWRATLGMRLVGLRILGAATADTLSINDALLRWLALSGAVSILTLVPGVGPYIGLLSIAWVLALLISTGTNRLHQGLHDRWARSVVVQPAPGGSSAAYATCLVLILLVVLLSFVAIAMAGDQVRDILSRVGQSI